MEYGSTVRRVRTALGMKQDEFAKKIGVSKGAVSQWENNIVQPKGKSYQSIENLRMMIDGESNIKLIDDPFSKVPLLNTVSAGKYLPITENYEGEHIEVPMKYYQKNETFALRVSGDSMECANREAIFHDDIVIVHSSKAAKEGDIVVAILGGDATIKKLVRDAGKYYLKPLNTQYQLIPVEDDTSIVGVVVATIREA